MKKSLPLYLCFFLFSLLWSGRAHAGGGVENYDSIYLSSTCANSNIRFHSSIFDSLPFTSLALWNFGDPAAGIYNQAAVQSPTHQYTSPGTYFISLTVVNSGTTDTVILHDTVNIVTPLNYNFGPDIYLCQGADTLLQAPVIAGATYEWNNGPPDSTQDTLRVTKSGVYTVSINGCGVSDSVGVFISTTPDIKLGGDHNMCDSANLLLNASTQNGQYTWYLNGALIPFTGGQLLTSYPGGAYAVSVNVPGCGVYGDTAVITYSSPLAPSFSLGPDTLLCPKQIDTLHARLAGATAWQWSTGSADSLIYIAQPGTYWVFVTYKGLCQVTDSVLIDYRQTLYLDFNDTSICQGSTLTLNADFGQGMYNWTANPAQRNDQNQTGQATYFVYNPGTFSVLATVGQCVYRDTIVVKFDDSLRVRLAADTTLCKGEDYWLQVSGNGDNYAWQDSSIGPAYRVTQSGVYTVVAQNGCGKDTLSTKVDLMSCACQLYLPNAFTPDGDGRNDNFRPLHACAMSDFHMSVYDRNGELVFRSADPLMAWDGTFGGGKEPAGAFVWMVRYFDTETKKPVFKKGVVMLIR